MAAEAEIMEARLGLDLEIVARAPVTGVAAAATGAIHEVVVALHTGHCPMLVVRKRDLDGSPARDHRFTQCYCGTRLQQKTRGERRNQGHYGNLARMSPEDEPPRSC